MGKPAPRFTYMKLLSSSNDIREITIGDSKKVIKRGKDATFEVPDHLGKGMKKGSEFAVVGTNFQSARGFECPTCHRMNVIKDSCGGCGWSSA